MSKARDLADLISAGNPLADGAVSVAEISDLTASAAELNKLDGVTASTAELNQVVGATSALQTQLDNISVTSGSLTKTFTQNETADITLSQGITSAPVVSATKEVPQTGVSTKGNWDVNSTASNYDFHNTAANVTLTPTNVFSLSAASYDNKSFTPASNNTGSCFFKSDGTKMYTSANTNDAVSEFALSTAWDVSTATYTTAFSVSANALNPEGLYFKPDGYKMYVWGISSSVVAEYDLSTAWNVSTASLNDTATFTSQVAADYGQDITFNGDGTKLYIASLDHKIYQYSLSTAYDITTASYDSVTLDVATYSTNPSDLTFNSDGTRLYICAFGSDTVAEYALTSAYDLSTASYNNVNFDLTGQTNGPQGLFIKPDSTKMYVNSSTVVYQYSSATTGLVLGSGSFASTDVGKRIVGNGGDVVLTSTGGAFSTTGGSAFTDSSTIAAGSWQMFGLKSAGDASGLTMPSIGTNTATHDSQLSVASQTTKPMDVDFNLDGTKAFVVDKNGNAIMQYNLSTAYLLSSASNVYNFSIASQDGNATGVFISETKMIVCGYNSNKLHLYNLGGTYQFSGGSGTSFYQDFDLNTNGSYSSGTNGVTCQLDANGNIAQIFTVSQNDTNVRHWTPAALNQVSNLTLTRSLDLANVSGITGSPQGHGIRFNNDGTKLFIVDEPNEVVYRLGLTTAYNISTASHEITFDISANSAGPTGIAIGKNNDSLMFITANTNDTLDKYNLVSNFTQPTAQYNVAVTNTSGRIDSSNFVDINSMTAAQSAGSGTVNYAVSTDGRTTWSVAKSTDGVRPIVRNNSGTWQYNSESSTTTTGYDFSTFAYANSSLSLSGYSLNDLAIKDDGTKIYWVDNNGHIRQQTLSTAYDLSTAGSQTYFDQDSQDNDPRDVVFKPDGTKMYLLGDQYNSVYQYTLSTAWDVTTASYDNKSHSLTNQMSSPQAVQFKSDGYTMYVKENTNILQYTLSTAWDVSTTSYANKSFNNQSQDTTMLGMFLKPDGTKMYTIGSDNDKIYEYNFGTAFDISTLTYSNNSYDISSSGNTVGRGMEISSDGTKIYTCDYSGQKIYQYTIGSTVPNFVTTPTWADGTTNDELYTLQQALSVAANRMDKTQLDAIPDANHFPTGTSLDLMIALRMDAAASTLPTSDGVTLNYDSASLNEGAVLGTDYDFFFPSSTKVQIKSLAAQNLKVRVV